MPDPHELARELCEQIISDWVHSDWVHDTIKEFLSERVGHFSEPDAGFWDLHDKIYELAHSAIITFPEEETK